MSSVIVVTRRYYYYYYFDRGTRSSRLDTIPACDLQTYGWTDTRRQRIPRSDTDIANFNRQGAAADSPRTQHSCRYSLGGSRDAEFRRQYCSNLCVCDANVTRATLC